MKKSERAAQARRELDRKLAGANLEPVRARPRAGWIRAVRNGLGMSQQALAGRLGIAGATVAALEESERRETISIGRLADIARALDCTLVYALVPDETLAATVEHEARRVAAQTADYAANTMRLEGQAVNDDRHDEAVRRLAQEVIDGNRLWTDT